MNPTPIINNSSITLIGWQVLSSRLIARNAHIWTDGKVLFTTTHNF